MLADLAAFILMNLKNWFKVYLIIRDNARVLFILSHAHRVIKTRKGLTFACLLLYRNDRAEMRGRKQPPAMRGGEKL